MSKAIGFTVKEFPAVRLVGRSARQSLNPGAENTGGRLWAGMAADGTMQRLYDLPGRLTPDPDTVGCMGGYDPASNSFTYFAGILTEAGTPVPEGLEHMDLPQCLIATCWIEGTHTDCDVFRGGHDHNARAMEENGYEFDMSAGGFEWEYFPYDRFSVPMEKGESTVIMGYCSPCRKKA